MPHKPNDILVPIHLLQGAAVNVIDRALVGQLHFESVFSNKKLFRLKVFKTRTHFSLANTVKRHQLFDGMSEEQLSKDSKGERVLAQKDFLFFREEKTLQLFFRRKMAKLEEGKPNHLTNFRNLTDVRVVRGEQALERLFGETQLHCQ